MWESDTLARFGAVEDGLEAASEGAGFGEEALRCAPPAYALPVDEPTSTIYSSGFSAFRTPTMRPEASSTISVRAPEGATTSTAK